MKKSLLLLSMIAMLTSCGIKTDDNSNENKSDTSVVETDDKKTEEQKTEEIEYVSGTYSNPVMVSTSSGTVFNSEVADPSVVRDPDTGEFYCFSTDRVVLHSEDGCSWEVYAQGDSVINFPTWGAEVQPGKSVNIWAPDVQKIGDIWYYFYSLSGWGSCCGIGYGVSDNIAGPYEDKGKLFSYLEIGINNAIDPNVIVEEETGDIYMTVGSFQGDYLVQLNQEDDGSITLFGGVEYQNDNKILIGGMPTAWDGSQYEGGYIIKKGEYYYYFGSAGTCCEGKKSTYRVMCGRSKDIKGPYIDPSNYPLTLSGGGTTKGKLVLWAGVDNENIAGCGHNSVIVDDAGDYWIYYHSYSKNDSFGTRHLFMDKLLWDEQGFPYVKTGKPSFDTELDGPRLK